MICGTNSRQICTPSHPGYVGNLPPDPSDAAVIELMSNVPYIGTAAATLFGGIMLKGGPVCVEDNRKSLKSTWKAEILAAILFGALVFGAVVYLIIKRK